MLKNHNLIIQYSIEQNTIQNTQEVSLEWAQRKLFYGGFRWFSVKKRHRKKEIGYDVTEWRRRDKASNSSG